MAGKSKQVPVHAIGKESGKIVWTGRMLKDKIKALNERGWKKFSRFLQRKEEVQIKPVKKGGTKALANAK